MKMFQNIEQQSIDPILKIFLLSRFRAKEKRNA